MLSYIKRSPGMDDPTLSREEKRMTIQGAHHHSSLTYVSPVCLDIKSRPVKSISCLKIDYQPGSPSINDGLVCRSVSPPPVDNTRILSIEGRMVRRKRLVGHSS